MSPAPSGRRGPSPAPPWLWFWLAVYLVTLPGQVPRWRALGGHIHRLVGNRSEGLLNALAVLEAVPLLVVLVGVVTILFPWLRGAWVERRFRLAVPAPAPVLDEIREVVDRHAPGLVVRTNLLRSDQLAFVYPLGYRAAALALFGGFVRLWRADRPAAEAVLLHELAHRRQGDALLVGAASLFRTLLERWLLLYLVLGLGPLVAIWTADRVVAVREILALEALGVRTEPWGLVGHLARQFVGVFLPQLVRLSLALACWTASVIVLPLLAIWTAELAADRFVVQVQGTAGPLARALGLVRGARSWWEWLLFRMSHPPVALRLLTARKAEAGRGLLLLVLLFPLGYVFRAVLLLGLQMATHLETAPLPDLPRALLAGAQTYLVTLAPVWLAMGAVLLVWPRLALGRTVRERTGQRVGAGAYGAAAVLVFAVGLAGLAVEGTAVERLRALRGGASPPAATWQRGDRVEVEWQGRWWAARILDVRDGAFFVHYEGFDASWDEWVLPSRIRRSATQQP